MLAETGRLNIIQELIFFPILESPRDFFESADWFIHFYIGKGKQKWKQTGKRRVDTVTVKKEIILRFPIRSGKNTYGGIETLYDNPLHV